MKNVYLVRHGQTLFNLLGKIQGSCDSPLTKRGIEQAKIASKYFKDNNIEFDAAFSSTSERAIDTLKLITDIDFTTRKDLKEWTFGIYEGCDVRLIPSRPFGDYFIQFGGESDSQVRERINNAIFDIAKNTDAKNILIVSHGAVIHEFYELHKVNNKINRDRYLDNCTISKYEFIDDKFILADVIFHDFSQIID